MSTQRGDLWPTLHTLEACLDALEDQNYRAGRGDTFDHHLDTRLEMFGWMTSKTNNTPKPPSTLLATVNRFKNDIGLFDYELIYSGQQGQQTRNMGPNIELPLLEVTASYPNPPNFGGWHAVNNLPNKEKVLTVSVRADPTNQYIFIINIGGKDKEIPKNKLSTLSTYIDGELRKTIWKK